MAPNVFAALLPGGMAHDNDALKNRLKTEAEKLGFVAFGVTAADHDHGAALDGWLTSGAHGEMGWMEARKDQRRGPQALWPEARSVIALGMSYAPSNPPRSRGGGGEADGGGVQNETPPDTPLHRSAVPLPVNGEDFARGQISVYAQGKDYHDVIKKALKALARWLIAEAGGELKVFVDTAPVMEKPLGQAAGLGWQGKHTNLVSRDHGSWLFLGSIFTTLDLPPHAPHEDQCGSCTACQTACPTNAFPAPYRLDARRCISYLTIELKGPIPDEFRAAMGNRIYGCDDCLAVCPWNKFADAAAANKAFAAREGMDGPVLAELLALDDAGFRARFAGSPIKRIGRDRMVRNAAIAAGNSGDLRLVPVLRSLSVDPDGVVAEAADWALRRLS
jgi:epoxyqueuosine reductase